MNPLNSYEKQVASHSKSLKPAFLPLLSWDIHMQYLNQVTKEKNDLNFLSQFSKKAVLEVDLVSELKENKSVIVVTAKDLKIEFVSNNMVAMTGYQPSEVLGKTPKIFQGPKTDANTLLQIRNSIKKEEKFEYIVDNYKKDKSIYKCHIKGYPVFDRKGLLINFVAVEKAA